MRFYEEQQSLANSQSDMAYGSAVVRVNNELAGEVYIAFDPDLAVEGESESGWFLSRSEADMDADKSFGEVLCASDKHLEPLYPGNALWQAICERPTRVVFMGAEPDPSLLPSMLAACGEPHGYMIRKWVRQGGRILFGQLDLTDIAAKRVET